MKLLTNPRSRAKEKPFLLTVLNKHFYASMVYFSKNKVRSEIRLSLLLFLLPLLFPLQINSYNPVDHYTINSGHSGNIIIDNRTWVGDVNTRLISTIEPQTGQPSFNADTYHPSEISTLFGSARLSISNFTYSFPVTINGPKFIRLHFYPVSYVNLEPSNALFSVKAGNLTLLKDFNPSLWLDNDEKTISREYCVNVKTGESLDITFIPSTNNSDSFAFINAIEVVSMPPFLYFTDPNDSGDNSKLVGQDTPYQVFKDKALETRYRVSVGLKPVPPSKDTGMFRNWDTDSRYLEKAYLYSVSTDFTHQPDYRDSAVPNYTAPADVYLSARSYGMNTTTDYNLTWDFEVDSKFAHKVRLHFCEFDYHISHVGDRAFQIIIADTMAEQDADVILWSGGRLVPVYRDYAVLFPQGSPEKLNLSIKLQRLPENMMTKYRDVTLNGIEIFKISDENNNLAEPNPEPIQSPKHQVLQTQSSRNSKTAITVIVAAVTVSGLVLASAVGIIVFQQRRRRSRKMDENSRETKTEERSTLPSHLCRYFTIAEIRAATNNFDEVSIIGVGGFGNVYKGYIDRTAPVAIKRLKKGSQQGAKEFMNEIELLTQLRHIHLVSLIGYCNDGAEMILVYDFMPRGTLREYLYRSSNSPLSWKRRLEISLGAARGLHYLHAGVKQHIIHRDVKSTNILLDEKWMAKVSDFGLSKVGPTGISTTHVSTAVKGSFGYLDPEYYKRQRLTLKSDVYSFGVVLLEVLCARPPLVNTVDEQETNLADWVRRCYDNGEIEKTVDPFVKNSITAECLKCYSQMAMSCLLDDGNQRPSMSDVVRKLEFALQLVESEEESKTQEEGNGEQISRLPQFMSDEGRDVRFTSADNYGVRELEISVG